MQKREDTHVCVQAQRVLWLSVSVAAVVSVFNIMVNYLYIHVFALHFEGAAMATVTSNWLLLLMYILTITLRYKYFAFLSANLQETPYTLSSLAAFCAHAVVGTSEPNIYQFVSMDIIANETDLEKKVEFEGGPLSVELIDEDEEEASNVDTQHFDFDSIDTWPPLSRDIFHGLLSFLRLGIPGFLSLFIEWGSFEVTSLVAARLGESVLATHAIFCQTAGVWYMPAIGLSAACSTLIGECVRDLSSLVSDCVRLSH